MASNDSTGKKSKKPVIAVSIAIAAVAVSAAVIVSVVGGGGNEEIDISDDAVPLVGYDSSATMVLNEDDLNAALDKMGTSAENEVALLYRNNAYSTDGKNFTCYIVNNPRNAYDMFLTIYSDANMTDEIFLSGLVPLGGGFEEITLEHELDKGDHTVYVVVTQVDTDESGAQVIKSQVSHTMEFHVE